jgi:hypothetical protein
MRRHAGLYLCLVTVLIASTAFADGDAAEAPDGPSLQELLERIEQLERDKADMADEMDELRTQVEDDWLTEQRADEIRNLVSDVLADADTRSSLLQDGMTAGWDEHFFLASPDGRFRLQFDGLMQIRWLWNYHDEGDQYISGFENTRTKFTLRGHVFGPDVEYLIRYNVARSGGGNGLQDAWVRYHLNDQLSVRFGQFKLPFNREELVRPGYQQVVERSLVNERLNIKRSQGIELTWTSRNSRFAIMASDGGQDNFGLVGTAPANSPWSTPDVEWAFTSRWEQLVAGSWDQFAQFTSPPGDPFALMWGIAGHAQRSEYTGAPSLGRDESYWLGATADVSAQFGGANLFGALIWQYYDTPNRDVFNVWGVVVQGGTYFTEKLEGFARFEYGHVDADFFIDFEDLWLLTVGANYYIDGQDLKLSADIGFGFDAIDVSWNSDIAGWRVDQAGGDPQVVFRTQFQLMF